MSDITRTPVKSSNVKSVGHDPNSNILAIEYSDGSIYHYHDVDKDTHDQLVAARSVGGFIHSSIKGVFKHSKQ